ncbi:protein kinase and PP2C-like domain-containing protein [Prunus avium]|uniref:Protein kinase and PP2C-like domain-containing protein n=1 Tax=Prunus avium TaxID=42229 RepID=A0A6P5RS83_PRUAV|nr:protein kinase and PP2C-like domain-containing protein [Prunus avium]XP_021807771.1 protein kinase and PP2C-like domain-containing protein [Prunus avium]
MGLEIMEPNACIRGCCSSNSIPLHLPPSSYTLLKPIARGAESVVYEAILDGKKVAVKKPIFSTPQGAAIAMVTRSIGDDDLKPAVTAEPEITETILSVEDEYLVMASDGLWDVVSNAEVVSIIKDTVKEPGMCSKRLATEAAERESKDNITVIVVFLRPVSTAERIY